MILSAGCKDSTPVPVCPRNVVRVVDFKKHRDIFFITQCHHIVKCRLKLLLKYGSHPNTLWLGNPPKLNISRPQKQCANRVDIGFEIRSWYWPLHEKISRYECRENIAILRLLIAESENIKDDLCALNSAFGKTDTPSLNHDPFRFDWYDTISTVVNERPYNAGKFWRRSCSWNNCGCWIAIVWFRQAKRPVETVEFLTTGAKEQISGYYQENRSAYLVFLLHAAFFSKVYFVRLAVNGEHY